ncbi:hypothetical protein [Nocardia wallacei]|uniref:hypothetical protein n=1 Tax=Nocardia wallacei TaxID=480035 RepID=UPI002454E89E|nr:hypothetical protein [Nocardia wallacei]
MRNRLRRTVFAGAVVAAFLLIVALGWANPPRAAVVTTDRLGPETGERVDDYLARARNSLTGAGADDAAGSDAGADADNGPDAGADAGAHADAGADAGAHADAGADAEAHADNGADDGAERWALASFGTGVTADRLPEQAAGLRISQVLYHVPLDRVYTPVTAVPVPAGDAAATASIRAAAGAMDYARPADDRAARTAAVVAARLHAGCPCAVAVVVRGTLPQLRDLASHPGIRSVEALPPDAAAGAFAVVPLLPEQLDTATPGPDDGPVPTP